LIVNVLHYMKIKLISAGAGSGKTYRLTEEMVGLLKNGTRASGIIATTFTAKAAAELQERVRTKLLEEGLTQEANDLSNALIGTVHGLGGCFAASGYYF
jgi:ATP-dependent helicase/nuclease subunit A